jgi:hypothetical protein
MEQELLWGRCLPDENGEENLYLGLTVLPSTNQEQVRTRTPSFSRFTVRIRSNRRPPYRRLGLCSTFWSSLDNQIVMVYVKSRRERYCIITFTGVVSRSKLSDL